jgi:V8-like Glu-specific endopeptidase
MSSSSGEMISGSCSVANGMSGAPVFSQARQLIGINAGSATLKFQYTVGQILSFRKKGGGKVL